MMYENNGKMEAEKPNRNRNIGLRLTQEEYVKIERKWKASTCRKLSNYIRHILFEKPVVTTFRDKSLDEYMSQLTVLNRELNAIGNNFNQTVKKLHTLNRMAEFQQWIVKHEMEKKILFNKVDEIKKHIQKVTEQWLQ